MNFSIVYQFNNFKEMMISKTWHKICLKLRNDELYIDKIPATKNENNLIKQINSYNYSKI